MKRTIHWLAGALLGMALAACGGGSGGGTVAEGGIGGTGISSGSISAFGSIVVNGTRFDIDAAAITVNGDPNADGNALEIGYVVRLDGDLDDAVAEAVRFEADLIGEVDVNNIPAGEAEGMLTVLQQEVRITPTTVITGTDSPDKIAPSDRVLVSGYRDSTETIVATHLALDPANATDQIIGTVDTSGPSVFTINGLAVNTNEQPDPGERVLVRGDHDPQTGEFTPNAPIEELEDLVSAGTEIELEGIVDRYDGDADFDVNGITVDAGGATIVDETGAPATIRENAEVEVEGVFDTGGTLVADRVEIELDENVALVARVANAPGAGDPVQFFPAGTPRLSVTVTDKTRLRDKSDADVPRFSVADLAQGDWVDLEAFEDGGGNVTALKLERLDVDDEDTVVIEARVDSVKGSILEVLGMTFDTSSVTGFDIDDVAPGDTVELEWDKWVHFVQPNMPVDDADNEN